MGPRRSLGLQRVIARLAARQVEVELSEEQEVERLLRRQAKEIRLRKLQRLMEPRGPPERSLTRQAMEQIRYLSRELPEDWPVPRLARGFQVEPEVIRRVLKSRFSPSPERSRRQDYKAATQKSDSTATAARHRGLLPKEATFRLLPAGPRETSSRPVTPKARPAPSAPEEEEEEQEAEAGCGRRVLSDTELEALAAEGRESQLKVVQKGQEVFDGDGNLLYRIPVPQQA
ncbi:neugrin [Rhineura floridana]|uniref:neugrin n=1 Tax=Rhineura floridana TaxID=261503 RepID=UPI002AC800FE|nr:neugrin [Rhineura floridana]